MQQCGSEWWWCMLWAGVAGGLTSLSKLPACNVLVIGAQKRTLSGFSTKAIMPHTGFVYYCDIVQRTPPVATTMLIIIIMIICAFLSHCKVITPQEVAALLQMFRWYVCRCVYLLWFRCTFFTSGMLEEEARNSKLCIKVDCGTRTVGILV